MPTPNIDFATQIQELQNQVSDLSRAASLNQASQPIQLQAKTVSTMTSVTSSITQTNSFKLNFITPIAIFSNVQGAVAWTTINLTGSGIPTTATTLILQAEGAMDYPDGVPEDAYMNSRANSSSPTYVMLRGRASGTSDDVSWSSQVFIPFDQSTFSFDYEITGSSGFGNNTGSTDNEGATLRLVGYV